MHSEEFDSTLAKLRPVIGDMADAFWLGALLDPARREDLEAVAQAMAAELLDESYVAKHILLEPPQAQAVAGEYRLGSVLYAGRPVCPFALRESDMPQHVLVIGRSGAGKTNVGHLLVSGLLRAGKPFIVLDWRGNYKHFGEEQGVPAFSLGQEESLSFNPLDPPENLSSGQREAYLRDVVSVVSTTYLPGHHLLTARGAEYFLLRALQHVCPDGEPVTFNDLLAYVEAQKTRSRCSEWRGAALTVLFRLTTGPVGRLANSAGGPPLAGILDSPAVFELDSIGSQTDRAFFTQALLLWLYYHRLAEGRSKAFKHALIVEEAHNLFLRHAGSEQSVHDSAMRQMRDLGQALILLDQNPSLVSVPALGNTGVTVCLNLKHADDVAAAGKALTLPRDQWEHIGRLPVGQGIVKLQDRWMKPFLVQFPLFAVPGPQPNAKTPRRKDRGSSVRGGIEELRRALDEAIRAVREAGRDEREEPGIGEKERRLLEDIAGHPLAVVSERYDRLGWTAHTGTRVKGRLLEKGLAEQENVSVPNGSVTLLKVTEQGRGLLASWGVQVKALPKNASLEHEYWKRMVAEDYRRKGFTVEEEVPIGGGRAVDLVASKEGRKIAIEIETGKSDVEGNVRKCKEAGFETVITVQTGKLHDRTAG